MLCRQFSLEQVIGAVFTASLARSALSVNVSPFICSITTLASFVRVTATQGLGSSLNFIATMSKQRVYFAFYWRWYGAEI